MEPTIPPQTGQAGAPKAPTPSLPAPTKYEDTTMDHDGITNVFKPGYGYGHGGGEGGLASALPLLLAGRADHGWGGMGAGGFGAGLVGGILGGALFNRRGGFLGGDGDGNCGAETRLQSNADTLAILGATNSVKDAVTGGFSTTALALSQGFANTKDAVQASTYLLSNQINNVNQNISEQGCATRETVLAAQTAILTALKDDRISELEDRVRTHEGRAHAKETEINVTQMVNQAQAQQQQQQQMNDHFTRLFGLMGNVINSQFQNAKTNQDIVNLGTMLASGTQSNANTQIK